MAGGASVHYVRHNAMSRQSRRHIFLDTEARSTYDNGIESQIWRLGVAGFLDMDPRRPEPVESQSDYLTPSALWGDVFHFTRPNSRTLLWAHNLAYDLRISRAFELLPTWGWSLQAVVVDGISCWAKWTCDDRTLVCADFTSWANVPLAVIRDWLRLPSVSLPAKDAPDSAWFERCRADVIALSEAVKHTLKWLKTEDLGNLQITGSGQSWSAFRHRFMNEKILVHDDKAVHEDERRALWTGRTETWRHGKYTTQPTYEFDLQRAYASIARDTALPTVYVGSLSRCSLANLQIWSSSRCLLSTCSVKTRHPIVPSSHNDRILWPVGQFRTTLWDCEIQALIDAGASVRLYRTHVYTKSYCLRDWATWILEAIASGEGAPDLLTRRICKQWSRSLIGRFALQYRSWTPMGHSTESDLNLTPVIGKGEKKGAQFMQAGHDLLELSELTHSENYLPQITGYITAVCRMRLWELMNVAGLEHVYYVDTDSIITDSTGAENLQRRIATDGAYGLAHKRTIRDLELLGPRQITVDGERRHSGIPRTGRQMGTDTVIGEVWEGLGTALRHGNPNEVRVYNREFKIAGKDERRQWLPDGTTAPFELTRATQN